MWAWPVWLVFAATGRRGELSGYPGRWSLEIWQESLQESLQEKPAELRIQDSKIDDNSKKSPTGPTERTPKPENLIPLATSLGVRW